VLQPEKILTPSGAPTGGTAPACCEPFTDDMSADLPRLTVVVPNYNHAQYLPRCLDAVLGQSVPPFEILVIDDASTDNSLDVLARYAQRHPSLRIERNDRNRGVVFGLNRGLELARGDYVCFPAADDELQPGYVEKSLRLLAEHPQAGLSCTVCRWCYVDSGLTWLMGAGMAERPCYLAPDDLVQLGRRGRLFLGTSSIIWRKSALREAGGFIPDLRWHCDWFAAFVPAMRHGVCYVPEPLSVFNIFSESYYSSGRRRGEHRAVLQRLVELLCAPACADVRPRIRDSGALSLFALPMLRILLSRREYRDFINATYLRQTLRRCAELTGKRILPRPLQRWCLETFYGRAT
jgi:glycosyltransferase involved in cell wall biosynthesis